MFRRKRSTEDFAEEIRSHLALETDELKSEGLVDAEAQRRAKVEFGSVGIAQERFNLRGHLIWFENFIRDLRFALRQFVKNPGFAITSILVLALGVGASVAIFAFVDAALLEPLPYANPTRIMLVNESSTESSLWPLSYPDFLDWQRLNKSFSSLDVCSPSGYLFRGPAGAQPVQGARVSGTFFQTLGVRPMLGRDFFPRENRLGGPNVVLLSFGAWVHRFGARRDIVGESVSLDNENYTVIGVLPQSFSFAISANAEFWVPINTLGNHEKMRTFYNFLGIGRLRDGVSASSALAEMKTIAAQLQQEYPNPGRDLSASVTPLSEFVAGKVRPILLTLLGGAGLLLLIACANVASLVLVHSEARRREIAVRGALGATPVRLARQFVTEGLLLAVFGCAGGIAIAAALLRFLTRLVPKDIAANMPFLDGVGMNTHTAEFTAAVALMIALLLGTIPILRLSFQTVRDGLADGDRGVASRLWRRLGANLVVVELAVAVVLLAGAALLCQSLYRLLHVSLGFDPDHVATLRVTTSGKSAEQMAGLLREISRRVSALPGVQSVGGGSMLPVQCDCATDRIQIKGRPDDGQHNEVDERHVSPGYLSALKTTLLRGRFFNEDDDASRPGVTVIDQTLAQKYFPGQDPIGQKLEDDEGGRMSEWEIVGIVGDMREGPLDAEIAPTEYFPLYQTHDPSFSLAVRTSQDAASLLPTLVSTLHQIDPNLGVSDEITMTDKIGATQAALLHRSVAWLVSGFAAIALVLGVVGLYGVIAYSVSQRTREIGVRMALGAQRSSVYRMIMRQAVILAAIGLGIGLLCSMGASMLIRNLLFGVQAWDAMTLGAVALLLALVSLAASLLPARRAASVNPVDALRAE